MIASATQTLPAPSAPADVVPDDVRHEWEALAEGSVKEVQAATKAPSALRSNGTIGWVEPR